MLSAGVSVGGFASVPLRGGLDMCVGISQAEERSSGALVVWFSQLRKEYSL